MSKEPYIEILEEMKITIDRTMTLIEMKDKRIAALVEGLESIGDWTKDVHVHEILRRVL